MRYTRISADCHIDMPWLPADLFTSNASAATKGRMPYVTDGPDGPYWTSKNGMSFGLVCGVGPSGQKLVPGQNHRVDRMAETGLYEDAKRGIRRVIDPHLRVKDAALDGVDAEVIFGILGAATRLGDHEAAREMFRIYNDWLVDFCRPYPDRHIGLACLPYGDIDAAVKEVHRVARLGLRGLELSCSWDMEPMWHPVWEPLWKAVSDVNLPLHFHTFPSVPASVREKAPTPLAQRAALFTGVSAFQMNLINILAALIGAAVLERYSNLRVVFGESGIGWIAYALDRMDFEWEDRFRDLGLTMKPSDYWRRQCKATFQFDKIGTKLIDDIGVESLMWGSDYPHPDGVWPESSKYIEEQFGHLPKDVVHKITCENAAKFYGLIKEGPGPRRRRRGSALRHPGRGHAPERSRSREGDVPHLQRLARGVREAVSRSLHRSRVPAVWRHRRRRQGDAPRGEDRHQRPRALVLVGHGAHVRPVLGAALAGRERGEPAAALPHVPIDPARHPREGGAARAPFRAVHRCVLVPDEPHQHPLGHHRCRRPRAVSEPAHRVRRERDRLASLRDRPHGLRMGGPLP